MGRKAQALLACLAATPGHRASRERLATLLWGDRMDEQARQSLRQGLAELRRILSDSAPTLLKIDRQDVALSEDAFTSDLQLFETALASGDLAALEAAARLWRGEFLAELDIPAPDYEDWLRDMREAWRLRSVALHLRLGRLLLDTGRRDDTLLTVNALTRLAPFDEEARRMELAAIARFQGGAAAWQCYQQFAALLQQEISAAPEPETRLLAERLSLGADSDRPPVPAAVLQPGPAEAPQRRSRWPVAAAAITLLLAIGAGLLAWPAPSPVMPSPFSIRVATIEGTGDSNAFVDTMKTSIAQLPVATLTGERRPTAFLVEIAVHAPTAGVEMINLRLVDAATRQTLWADSLSPPPANRSAAASEATVRMYVALLTDMEKRRDGVSPASPALREGWALFNGRITRERTAEARQFFQQAVAATPDDPGAQLGLGYSITQELLNRWSMQIERDTMLAQENLEFAIRKLPRDQNALIALGMLHKTRRDYARALMTWRVVLAINPRESSTHAQMAHVLLLTGQAAEGLERAEMALQLQGPQRARDRTYFYAGMGRLLTGDDQRAEVYFTRAIALNPNLPDVHAWHAAALAHQGREDEARMTYTEMRQRFPAWDIDHHVMQASDRSAMARFVSGIEKLRKTD